MQIMQIIGDRNVRLIPDVLVGGGSVGTSNGLVDGLLTMLLWKETGKDLHPDQSSAKNPTDDSPTPQINSDDVVDFNSSLLSTAIGQNELGKSRS